MKIAIFGWYGHHNAGDERIKFCLHSFLMSQGGISEVNFYDLHEEAINGATNKFDNYDLLIIGGGGLILSRHNYHDFILGIKTKLVTIGISVETLLKGNPRKFAQALIQKSQHFFVRDNKSAAMLNALHANSVKVSSDLTFLVPYESIDRSNNGTIGINLLPKPQDFNYATLSSPYLSFMLGQLGRIGLSNVLRVVSFKDMVEHLTKQYTLLPIPLYCANQNPNGPIYQKNDVNFLTMYFNEVQDTYSHSLIDKCQVFLSMRLHGAIFAVQKGIPVISFEYLPKNKNFMREVGLDDFAIKDTKPEFIAQLVERCIKEDTSIKDQMAVFTENASKKIRNDLIDILNSMH